MGNDFQKSALSSFFNFVRVKAAFQPHVAQLLLKDLLTTSFYFPKAPINCIRKKSETEIREGNGKSYG